MQQIESNDFSFYGLVKPSNAQTNSYGSKIDEPFKFYKF